MHESEMLIRRWFEEVWNRGRLDAIDEMLANDYATRGLSDDANGAPSERESMKAFRKQFATEFSKLKIDIQDIVADGPRVALRCTVDVTQANTGKEARFAGMCFAHVKDGKIAQAWNNFDFASMRRQLA